MECFYCGKETLILTTHGNYCVNCGKYQPEVPHKPKPSKKPKEGKK